MNRYLFLFVVLFSVILVGCPSPNLDSNSPDNAGNYKYAKEYWGEWLRMDANETWYISSGSIKINNSSTSKNVSLSKQSDRVMKVKEGGREYYLYASRIANTSFSGKIVGFEQPAQSVQRAAAGGKGWINVVIKDINDKTNTTTATTDGDGNFTADGIIPGDSYEVTPDGGSPTTVTPMGDGDDVGTITITGGLNFKTSIKSASNYYGSVHDMTRLYANMNAYKLVIVVENTGTVDCLAATYSLAFPDDLIAEEVPASLILGTIEKGKTKTIDITVRCKEIQNEYEYKKIGVTVTDPINGSKTWTDSVSLKFHKAPVNFNIRTNKKVSGVVIAPTAQAYTFRDVTSATFSMPWSTKDYLIVFSGATADTEAVYSLGIGVIPDTNFDAFSDTGNYEPNNTEITAQTIYIKNKIMSYLHKNDIDYYKVNMGATAPVVSPVALTNFACLDTANSTNKIQPGRSAYLDIMVKNNVNAVMKDISAALSTTSGYVTLNKSDGTIGNLGTGYYQTLTYKSNQGSSSTGTSGSSNTLLFCSSWYYSSAFKFTLSSSCPVGTNIPFVVTFTDFWNNEWTYEFTVTVE